MGHIKSRGKTSVARIAEAPDALWPTWRALVKEFGLRRLMLHLVRSGSGWGFYGLDLVSTLRATPMAKAGLTVLEPVDDRLLGRLADLASVNARRQEAIWRFAALFYITVPVTLFLAGLQGAPEFIRDYIVMMGWIGAVLAVGLTVQMIYYFASLWRARQIEAVIDIARIERGLDLTDR